MLLTQRKHNRLKEFNYSSAGYYFLTICVKDKICCLGNVADGKMILNTYGKIVKQQWLWLKQQYKYVDLDEFMVMPNHFHGILIIRPVGNGRDHSLQQKIKPLPELIGAFKTTSSKLIHKTGFVIFTWQKSFYDHIVRKDETLNKIREYVLNNPKQWEMDQENPKNLKQ